MTRGVFLGRTIVDHFPIWDWQGKSKTSGQTVFLVSLWCNGVASNVPVTVAEIGTSGEYKVEFAPDALGIWSVEIVNGFNRDAWHGEYDVKPPVVDVQSTMADNGTIATFALWVEIDGERRVDFDSIGAQIKDATGATVHDFGVQTTQTSDGVFSFAIDSATLAFHVPYYIATTVRRGQEEYKANIGFAKG